MKNKLVVDNSSTIKSLEYDSIKLNLIVEFKAGSKYKYRDVDADTARELFEAESKGRYFAVHVKDDFVTEKISASTNAPKAPKVVSSVAWPFPISTRP